MKMQTLIMGSDQQSTFDPKSREEWYPIFKQNQSNSCAKLRLKSKFYPNASKWFSGGQTIFEGKPIK